jgi:hypothetical protein
MDAVTFVYIQVTEIFMNYNLSTNIIVIIINWLYGAEH